MSDYINIKNWQISRERNIDKNNPDWVRFKYIENGDLIQKSLPDCSKIYYKYDGSDIIEMSTSEKAEVDDAIQLAIDKQPKDRIQIMGEIFNTFTGDDRTRILNCIDKKGSFRDALDGYNYILARQIMEDAKAEGLINQIDYNIIAGTDVLKGILPKQD
jgi:hypothetical protein